MELILIAFVGTALLMAAELREFIQRGRTYSAEALSARPHSDTRVPVAAANDHFYDAAA